MDNERSIAEELLGKVDARSRVLDNGLTSEDLDKLNTPLEAEEGESVYVFCTGHHSVFPINSDGRTELARLAGAKTPDDWAGKYFEVSGCPFCDRRFQNPVLKDYRM